MQNLTTAIFSKLSGSALSNDINGQLFKGRAPSNTRLPYIVFSVPSDAPQYTFTESFEGAIVLFDLYSDSISVLEISTMYADLKTLYDECSLTITGETLVWMREASVSTSVEDITTQDGIQQVKHWAVNFDVLTQI